MAELTINHLIKIIIGIMVVIAAVIGVSMFFGVKVTDFFRGIPGFFDGECDPEKENCEEEEEEEEETEVRETCNEIIHVNGTEITKRPQAEGKIEGTITKTYNAENEKGRVRITGKGEGLKGKMKMIIKITRDEETIIKEEKEIELSLRSSESHEISFNANVQEEDVIEFEITKTECHRGRDCGFVKMQDFTITGCPDKCNENQDCEDDEYCSSSKKCRKQSCPEGNYCFEGNVYESEAKNHVCEGKEIKKCECGCSNGDCTECPTQTETCTECAVFRFEKTGAEYIVKTKTKINLKDETAEYGRVNEGKAKNRMGEIDLECSQWFFDGNKNGMQEKGEPCMTWGCQGDRAVRNSFELNENEKSEYEECKEKKLTFSHEGTEYRVISENMIIRRIDAEQFRKITTGTPCNTWFHNANANEEHDEGEEEMSDEWNCVADGKVDEFTKNPPDSCSNLNEIHIFRRKDGEIYRKHSYIDQYKKYEELMIEAIKSEGWECKVEHPRALMAAFISVESDWLEDSKYGERNEGDRLDRASWGLMQTLSYYENGKYYICDGWETEEDELKNILSRMVRKDNFLFPEDVNYSLICGARVIANKINVHSRLKYSKQEGTYICNDKKYMGLKALARLYNGWQQESESCNRGNINYVEDIFYEEGFHAKPKGKYYDWVACISQLDKEKGEDPLENRNHCG